MIKTMGALKSLLFKNTVITC